MPFLPVRLTLPYLKTHSQDRYCLPLRTQPDGAARKASHACLSSYFPICYSRNSESETVFDISNYYLSVWHTNCVLITRNNKDAIRRYTNFITANPKQLHVSAAENLKINVCKGEISDIDFIVIYIYIYIYIYIQWRPLIIIADNVINRLLLSKSVVPKHYI